MSERSVDRIRDIAIWFHENKDRGRSYDKEREFVHRNIDFLLELCSHLLEDIQILEGRKGRNALIWTPNGVTSQTHDE